ncbi:MAG: AbrB/MazE/SpoVT family DNA-binding domain-containing protein [archaeon]
MIDTMKVSSRGQVVIPESMRKKLNIEEGTKLIIKEVENKLIIELEKEFLQNLELLEKRKENQGWLSIAEKNMENLWNNKEDENEWSKYL